MPIRSTLDVARPHAADAARLRMSEARYRRFFERAHDGIFVCDANARIVEANPALAELCGRPLEELIGLSVAALIDPDDLARTPLRFAELASRGRLETQRTFRRPDGTRVFVDVGVQQLDDGEIECIVRDVTERRLMEEQLRANAARLRGIFDGTFQFVGLLSATGELLEANRASLAFIGHDDVAGLRGQPFWETPWWHHSRVAQERLQAAVARAGRGDFVRYEAEHVAPDGRVIIVDFSLQPISAVDGTVAFIVAEGRDVTETRQVEAQLRASEETFRSSFEYSGIGMAIVGLDGRWLRVNRALCQIVGYDESTLLAGHFQDITHPDDLDVDLTFMRQLLAGARDWYQLEKRYVRADGQIVWVLLNGSVVRDADGAPRHFVAQIQDVTERKRTEDALARQHLELARSNAELEQFAYVASHDLQEPLRTMASYAQLLNERYAPQLDERAQRYLRYMVQGSERMRALIDDVLALSRVGSRGQPFAAVPLGTILDDVLLRLQPAIQETGAIVTRATLPVVLGDAAQLGQLLQNLLANALKFRRPDLTPRVDVTAERGEREWVIAIRDNGIGIDPRFHERVFAIFKRLHTHDEYPGTGIGLAICKKVVERHGGRIWVGAAPGGGSVFQFTLPITDVTGTVSEGGA